MRRIPNPRLKTMRGSLQFLGCSLPIPEKRKRRGTPLKEGHRETEEGRESQPHLRKNRVEAPGYVSEQKQLGIGEEAKEKGMRAHEDQKRERTAWADAVEKRRKLPLNPEGGVEIPSWAETHRGGQGLHAEDNR